MNLRIDVRASCEGMTPPGDMGYQPMRGAFEEQKSPVARLRPHGLVARVTGIILGMMLSTAVQAQEKRPQAKPWAEMDRGPYLTASIESSAAERQVTPKGIMIRVRQDPPAHVLFDADLLRYSVAWTGGTIDYRGIVFDGAHQLWPAVQGEQLFGTKNSPGWARGGSFDDPRTRYPSTAEKPQPEHWRNRAYGPLPHDHARFKGLYLHGQRVVLSYTVANVAVLDSPGLETIDGVEFFSREINVAPSSKDLTLNVAEGVMWTMIQPEGTRGRFTRHLDTFQFDGFAIVLVETAPSVLTPRDTRPRITPEYSESSFRLRIPASSQRTRFKLLFTKTPTDATKDEAPRAVDRRLEEARTKSPSPLDLADCTKGGPARWPEKLTTKGTLGTSPSAYVVDTITAPTPNPWKAMMRFGGFDFFKDASRAAICTWDGDVWIVSGINETLENLTWQRIATGMFQPLGLKIVPDADGKEQIYVCCRDQITKLHDLNGDGEADFYEAFNNDHQVTEHFHEFAMDLQTDAEGNFYYAKSARHALPPVVPQHGTLIKVSKDGSKSEVLAGGFRAANGVGISPSGELATSDQEGHWTPANRINLLKPGGFYGNMWSYVAKGRKPSDGYDAPVVWMPKDLDRSPASQLWVTSEKWGPLKGKMIHTSYGTGKLALIPYETVESMPQGAYVPFPHIQFPTGVMRARFHPTDGQLYACGLVGWSSNTPLPGGFYRVRYTNQPLRMPIDFKARKDGISLSFPEPLDRTSAEDAENYSVEIWNYRWTQNYGSAHYALSDPNKKGADSVEVKNALLSPDGKTIHLRFEELRPVMQMKIVLKLKSADGGPVESTIHNTIHQLPPD